MCRWGGLLSLIWSSPQGKGLQNQVLEKEWQSHMYTHNLFRPTSQESNALQWDLHLSLSAQLCSPGTAALMGNIFQTSVGMQRKFPSTYIGDQFKQESFASSVWREGAGGMISCGIKSYYPAAHSFLEEQQDTRYWSPLFFFKWKSSRGQRQSLCLVDCPAATMVFLPPAVTLQIPGMKFQLVLTLCVRDPGFSFQKHGNEVRGLLGEKNKASRFEFWEIKTRNHTVSLKPTSPRVSRCSEQTVTSRPSELLQFHNPISVWTSCSIPLWWSDVSLHTLLERPREVWVLWGGLGVVGGGRGRSLAVFVKLHIAFRFTVTAHTAVALRVDKWTGVAQRAALELALTQLDGATTHAQHKALAVVIKAVRPSPKSGVDVGEGHARGNPLLAEGPCAGGVPSLRGLIPSHGGCMVLLEGVDAVVAICWVLLKAHKIISLLWYSGSAILTTYFVMWKKGPTSSPEFFV